MSRPELSDLVEELHDVRTKWYSIGIQLKVPGETLKAIKSANDDVGEALREMLEEWLKQINQEPTWASIVKALRRRSVNEQRLAENLERRFCTPSAPHDATDSTAIATWSANTASGSEQVLDPDLQREVEELHSLFEKLRMDVYRFLSKELPDLDEFRVFVSSPPPAWKLKRQRPLTDVDLDRIMRSDKFHEVYMVLSQYITWYNYELLKSIVEKYANPQIKQQMEDYCARLDDFEKRTNLDKVKNISFCQLLPDSVAFIVRMRDHRCNQFCLNEIRRMQHTLADEAGMDRGAVRTHMVVSSSVNIIFLVPLALAPYLMVSSVPLLSSQDPLPESVYDRCVSVIKTEEAFRLMERPLPPPRPALPAPPRQSLSSSYSDEPQLKSLSLQPTLNPCHVEVFHDNVLDAGAYTFVCEARLHHLPCVAKYVHTKLDESYNWPREKFMEGCKFLESCHHPNIVTFLGMHYDESLRVPILLMEKMDQSLHNYLEQATHPIPIYAQLDICHDIAQGLEYIHSREYIHGDLTATNILLQGRRAKIGGMMTLQCKFPDVELSLCPGTPVYTPTPSLDDYDESIDCFSFGFVAIHIATGEMPNPLSHSTELSGESECYHESTAKVNADNPMHSIILRCLKDQSMERPSAANLCKEILAMKETKEYKTSLYLATLPMRLLTLQNQIIQQRLHEKKAEINAMKQEHQRLQEEREIMRQEMLADAEREIESVRHQEKFEREKMEASFQKEREQVRNEAKRDLQKATDEKVKLEKVLKCEIDQVKTTWTEKVKKAIEEWKTKSENEQRMLKEQSQHKLSAMMEEKNKILHDLQARNEEVRNLGSKLEQLEIEKRLLQEKLEEADQSYARMVQAAQHGQ